MKRTTCALALSVALALPVLVPGVAPARQATQTRDVAAFDFGFQGLGGGPWESKRYVISFENTSDENLHEFVIYKNKSDKNPREIIRLAYKDEDEANKYVKFMGAAFAKPGKSAKKNIEAFFKPGKYFAACFVQNSKKSEPHWKKGMLFKFSVQG